LKNLNNISLRDFAGYISSELNKAGIDATLVGGACVTIYSKNRYQSYDLDFVSYKSIKKIQ
jgi:ABC-type transport system substrate-binding protein